MTGTPLRAGLTLLPLALAALLSACTRPLSPDEREKLLEKADEALVAGRLQQAEALFRQVTRSAPDDGRALFGLGLARLRQGQPAAALPLFERAAQVQAGNPDHAYLRAHTLALIGRREEAIDAFSALVRSHPDHLPATLEMLNLLIEAGRLEESRQIVMEALKRSPHEFGLLLSAGRILGLGGAHGESAAHYDRARALRPYALEPVYGLIEAYRHTGRIEDSIALMKEFEDLKIKARALQAMRDDAARSPTDPQPALRYIRRLFDEGRLDEAADSTAGFLSQFPEVAAGGELAVRAADASLRAGDMEGVRRFLRAAETLGRRSSEEIVTLAEAHAALGEFKEAMALYERRLEETPDDPRALLGLGRAALKSDQLDAAERSLRRSVELMPAQAGPHASLGLLLLRRGRVEAANRELRAALELDPGQADARFGMGFVAHQRRDMAGAEDHLRRALERQPDHGNALAVLALVLSEQGRCVEAIPLFTRALDAEYRSMTLHAGLVRCLEATGRAAEAEQARKLVEQLLGKAP